LYFKGTIKQGKRRLKRAFKSLEIQSMDCEYVSLNESVPLVLNNIDLEKELDDVQTRIIDSDTNGIEIFDTIEIRNIDENASTSKENTSTTHGKFSDVLYFILIPYTIPRFNNGFHKFLLNEVDTA